jgi:hypothetical protein
VSREAEKTYPQRCSSTTRYSRPPACTGQGMRSSRRERVSSVPAILGQLANRLFLKMEPQPRQLWQSQFAPPDLQMPVDYAPEIKYPVVREVLVKSGVDASEYRKVRARHLKPSTFVKASSRSVSSVRRSRSRRTLHCGRRSVHTAPLSLRASSR